MAQKNQNGKILGIGTPIIDYLIKVSDDYISHLPGLRGGSTVVDFPALQNILKDQHSVHLAAGGSSANTIKGLTKLGHACAFSGKIGQDDTGKQFYQKIESYGITTHLTTSTLPTAQVACLITPDNDRTMRAYLGAGTEMNVGDLDASLFENIQLLYIEGYLMNRPGFVEKAMKLAKEAGAKVSFDLSSFEIVKEFKQPISALLSRFVDIVFANEEEAQTLTGLPPEKACGFMRDLCGMAVVKAGGNGSFAATKTKKTFHEAFKVKVVDTTGAGDLFASGFLHGYLLDKSLEECLGYGSYVAAYVIQVFGAEIPENLWPTINANLLDFKGARTPLRA